MALDLKLLPYFLGGKNDECNHSQSIIEMSINRELFDKIMIIEDISGRNVKPDFHSYLSTDWKTGENCYGETIETPYGEKLKFVKAEHLQKIFKEGENNLPEHAYILALDPDHKIALYWC